MYITSDSGNHIKRIRRLLEKSRARRDEGCFIAEGIRMVSETPPERIDELFVSESLMSGDRVADPALAHLMDELDDDRIHTVSDRVFKNLSDTVTPQGVLAIVRMSFARGEEIFEKADPLIMVLSDLQDPGNLGTIVRTSEGAGVDAIVMSRGCVDIYSPKVVRATMGSLYRMPHLVTEDLRDFLIRMKDHGIKLYGAELSGSVLYDECDYTGGSAILIGNEGAGLAEDILGVCDRRIRIPMEGKVESLNAAVSAGIIAYEAAGQRRHMD